MSSTTTTDNSGADKAILHPYTVTVTAPKGYVYRVGAKSHEEREEVCDRAMALGWLATGEPGWRKGDGLMGFDQWCHDVEAAYRQREGN